MNIKELILSSRSLLASFDYDHYPDSFSAFSAQAAPFLGAPSVDPDQLIDQLAGEWEGLPRKERAEVAFEIKQVLALFLSPAADRIGGPAKEYAAALCEKWNKRFPRNRYLQGDFASIMKGFDHNLLGLPLRKSRR